jgi:hypothetical protein
MSLFPSSSYSELSPAEIEKLVGFDYDTPIWFKDPDFIDEEDDVIDGYTLDGENTIQKVFYSNHDRAYYMIIHPEYFGSTSHDDPDGADAMLTIVGLAVSVRPGGGYIPCLTGNLVTVPSKYVQENDDKEPYLDCIVELMYINFDSDTVNPLTWKQAFLNINALLN